jgi:hypothetical protein
LPYGGVAQMRKAGGVHENVLPLCGINTRSIPGANINDAVDHCPCFFSNS